MISAEASVEIARPVADVFRFVADPANEPAWHTDVISGRLEPAGEPGAGKVLHGRFKAFGRTADAVADVTTFEPDRRIVYAFRAATFGLRPTLTYSFERVDAGTRFTRRVDAEPFGVFRILAPIMGGQIAKRSAGFVQNLKRRLESQS